MADEQGQGAAQPRRGGGLAWLAVLFALVALAAVGYSFYREEAAAASRAAVAAAQEARIDALKSELESALVGLAERAAQQNAALDARAARFEADVNRLAEQVAGQRPDERVWLRAEVAHLVRAAEQRARLARDAAGAEALLAEARAVLTELEDPAFEALAAAIDASRATLRETRAPDLAALYAHLSALQASFDELPVRMPSFESEAPGGAATEPSAAAEPGLVERSVERLASLFDFRRRGEATPRPLLGPDEERFLRMSLAALTDEAQLALLRGEATVYRSSLAECEALVSRYLDPADPRVVDAQRSLASLREAEVVAPAVDLSHLLEFLQRAGERATARAVAPAVASETPRRSPQGGATAVDGARDGAATDAVGEESSPAPGESTP
jgi:uroporphyrin-3 C-methyltransferase